MADIAILVAEEYERRVKNRRKAGGGAADQEEYCEIVHLVSSASAMAQSLKMKRMALAKWVREPKTQISLAAFDGFFSA